MRPIPIYTTHKSPRLAYVLRWLLCERLRVEYVLTEDLPDTGTYIAYGAPGGTISIPAHGLLNETGSLPHTITTGEWSNVPTLYANDDTSYTLPFDICSALFFLLSRYEEYYPFTPDKYGRYPATESVLHKNGWLQRPIADEWVSMFGKLLEEKLGLKLPARRFIFQPSYDIDIAWSYKNKGAVRTMGALVKDGLKGKIGLVRERLAVLLQNTKDPYDSFGRLNVLHKEAGIQPLYFVLAALATTPYDKNIHPEQKEMKALIQQLAAKGDIGIHPSYYSDKAGVLEKEKSVLEKITGRSISISRQHYIKLRLPGTYRLLIQNGITEDYSMGYGTHLGFRAGTGAPFYWYDLQNEQPTSLRIYPFCFMDTTALYEEQLTADEAFEKLRTMTTLLRENNSMLITVFHNFSLGTSNEWNGWCEQYSRFVKEVALKL